jgi:hypothetical protein
MCIEAAAKWVEFVLVSWLQVLVSTLKEIIIDK